MCRGTGRGRRGTRSWSCCRPAPPGHFGVHLSAIHAAWTERRRVGEVAALLDAIARWREGPHVLVGDFNTLPPGEILEMRRLPPRLRPFVWLSGGQIRWQVVSRLLESG